MSKFKKKTNTVQIEQNRLRKSGRAAAIPAQ